MSGSASQASVEYDGAVAVLRFKNDPSGVISTKGAAQLSEAIEGLLRETSVRALVLTGATPGVFIRHADVSQILRAGEALAANRIGPEDFLTSPFLRLSRLCESSPVPIIAAINGVCMGGGLEIALCCTYRIAGNAVGQIGLPEIRLDIFPGLGGMRRLAHLIGEHQARAFVLRGAVVAAQQALSIGLVDEITDSAVSRAMELAHELAGRSPAAIRAIMGSAQFADPCAAEREQVVKFAALLRDHPDIRNRLREFIASGHELEAIP